MIDATQDYRLSIPTDWILLPTIIDDVDSYLQTAVGALELGADASARLLYGLKSVTAVSHSRPRGARASWALVQKPASGRVDALISLNMLVQDDGSFERYRRAAEAAPADGPVELIKRSVSTIECPVGPAIVVHDFTLERNAGGVPDPALERAVVALFPSGFEKAFEFMLLTQDLALFDDVSDFLAQFVSTITSAADGRS